MATRHFPSSILRRGSWILELHFCTLPQKASRLTHLPLVHLWTMQPVCWRSPTLIICRACFFKWVMWVTPTLIMKPNLTTWSYQMTLEFTANAQIFPRSLNTAIGGDSNATYLIIQDSGPLGQGLNFVNGFTFLCVKPIRSQLVLIRILLWSSQRFYSVFDTSNQRVGFANTPATTATSN